MQRTFDQRGASPSPGSHWKFRIFFSRLNFQVQPPTSQPWTAGYTQATPQTSFVPMTSMMYNYSNQFGMLINLCSILSFFFINRTKHVIRHVPEQRQSTATDNQVSPSGSKCKVIDSIAQWQWASAHGAMMCQRRRCEWSITWTRRISSSLNMASRR